MVHSKLPITPLGLQLINLLFPSGTFEDDDFPQAPGKGDT